MSSSEKEKIEEMLRDIREDDNVRNSITESAFIMGKQIGAFAIANLNHNYQSFAAYLLENNPTPSEMHRAVAELLAYCTDAAARAIFAISADSLGIDEDNIDQEYSNTAQRVTERVRGGNASGFSEIKATLNAANAKELYTMCMEKSGPFSEYLQNNSPRRYQNAETENSSED